MTRERRLTIISLILLVAFLSLPLWGRRATMNTLTEFLYLLAIAQLWNLLAGYAGLVSVGQQAWIGFSCHQPLSKEHLDIFYSSAKLNNYYYYVTVVIKHQTKLRGVEHKVYTGRDWR